jgi:hypothetical protein
MKKLLPAMMLGCCLIAPAVMAEPVKLSDSQLDDTFAGHGRGGDRFKSGPLKHSAASLISQIANSTSQAIAICIGCTNSTVVAISNATSINTISARLGSIPTRRH